MMAYADYKWAISLAKYLLTDNIYINVFHLGKNTQALRNLRASYIALRNLGCGARGTLRAFR